MRVKRQELLKSLEAAAPGLASREVVEQSLCFAFRGGRVTTFNDEVACSVACPLEADGAIPAAPLLALLRKLDEDELDAEIAGGELLIRGKRRRSGIRVEEISMPLEGIERPGEWRKLPEGFLDAVGIVRSCASSDQSQFVLTCVHVHPEWVEACDSFQIARHLLTTGFERSMLIKCRSLEAVSGMDVTEVSEVENWVHFRNPAGLTLSCRRYSEDYPELDKYLDVEGEEAELPKELEGAVDKAAVFGERGSMVTVEFKPGKAKLTGRGPTGWFSQLCQASWTGGELSFQIAPKLLLEIMRRSAKVVIGKGKIAASVDSWRYVACTNEVEEDSR